KGEHPEKGQGTFYRVSKPPRAIYGGKQRTDNYHNFNRRDRYQPTLTAAPIVPLMVGPPKKENLDRYRDYHGEKGHNTNDCFQLKRQLEAALEFGMLVQH
ncbi:hypothetical protein Tco_0329592, partial [Tanacetum coccineum]